MMFSGAGLFSLLQIALLIPPGFSRAAPPPFDHSAYDSLLRRYVNEEGLVDYDGLRKGGLKALEGYLARVAQADPSGWAEAEKTAFWVNAYNGRMLWNIVFLPSMKRVSENFRLFDEPFALAGGRYSLNDVEHRLLRGRINKKNRKGPVAGLTASRPDPRIHFALVCAAIDCPRLQSFAYTAQNLESTLDSAALQFASLSRHVAIENGRLRLSMLLMWYKEDFDAAGGVAAFLDPYLARSKRPDKEAIRSLLKTRLGKAVYDYDWTVNDVKNRP